ncbi:MAG TPA: hypothetical protein VKU02_06235 [Gemmataceae bacterium]|nr:hypothetical protein [Gemmataceae bacterium]
MESRLSQREVLVHLVPPARQPERFSLRLPFPAGWRIQPATSGDMVLAPKDEYVEILPCSSRFMLRFRLEAIKP